MPNHIEESSDPGLGMSSYTEGMDISLITSPEELMEELDIVETRYKELSARVENAICDIRELGAPSGNANFLTIAEMCESLGVLAVIAENLYLSLMTLYDLRVHRFAARGSIDGYSRMARDCNVMAEYYRKKVSEHAYDAELFTRAYRPDEDAKLTLARAEIAEQLDGVLVSPNVPWIENQEDAAA